MLAEILYWLEAADKAFFVLINYTLHVEWLDGFMQLMRTPLTWIPLYIFVLYWVYKSKNDVFFSFLIISLLTFAITDYTSASILKPLFQRLRPCYDPLLVNKINIIEDCGGQYSMPSSHASNHFGLAMLWFWIVWYLKRKRWNWLWVWAGIICYAQVYTGKHFPFDIAVGALLGVTTGTCMAKFFEYWHLNRKKKFRLFSIRLYNRANMRQKLTR
ncbi:MAG: phosphatase PAP2 family protein [Panacibacter sp.]